MFLIEIRLLHFASVWTEPLAVGTTRVQMDESSAAAHKGALGDLSPASEG
jgi:hypothetical protein